jgi:hypothetical protein
MILVKKNKMSKRLWNGCCCTCYVDATVICEEVWGLWPKQQLLLVFSSNEYMPCSLELISYGTVFFSYNKLASVSLSAVETIRCSKIVVTSRRKHVDRGR